MAIKCGVFKTTYEDDEAIWQTKVAKFWVGLLLIALIAFPFVFQGSRYLLYVVNSVLIAVIAAPPIVGVCVSSAIIVSYTL